MLSEIAVDFASEKLARKALTAFRQIHRVALRGAVPEQMHKADGSGTCWRVQVPLDGTGFSRAEFASALVACGVKLS